MRPETFMLLIRCVIDDTLSSPMPHYRQALLKFIDVMNLTSVANIFMHASMPKEDDLAFILTQAYTFN